MPQTKHCDSGRATTGIGPSWAGARSGRGGGGERGASTAAGAAGSTEAGGAPDRTGAGVGGDGFVPLPADGARALTGAGLDPAGFPGGDASDFFDASFGASSDSLRRRRKNDIALT